MADDEFKVCPFCKEKIRQEAIKCRFWGEWLEQSTRAGAGLPQAQAPTESIFPPPLPKSDEPPPPATDVEQALTPAKEKKETPVKTLNWISAALLSICVLVWFISLAAIHWTKLSPEKQGDVTEKLTGAFLRLLFCAGLLAWTVKRKGYRLLTFSTVCLVMTAISAYYFQVGKQQSKQQTQESNAQLVENVQGTLSNVVKFGQAGATENFPNDIKTTGDAVNDALSLWANNMSREIGRASCR